MIQLPEPIKAILWPIHSKNRSPGVGFCNPPISLQNNHLGPDLVIYAVPLGEDLNDVILIIEWYLVFIKDVIKIVTSSISSDDNHLFNSIPTRLKVIYIQFKKRYRDIKTAGDDNQKVVITMPSSGEHDRHIPLCNQSKYHT